MSARLKLTSRKAEKTSAIMRRVSSTDTAPEIIFRKALRREGLRYAVCSPNLPGKPDIVLTSKRLAIFIDGDLWHGGQWRRRRKVALEDQFSQTSSKEYWVNKIRRNMHRDCVSANALMSAGWTVLRFWESQIYKDLEQCVKTTLDTLENRAMPTSLSLLPKKSFAEFFAGVGLMRMGLERQGWSIEFANDIDPLKHEMYLAQFVDQTSHFLIGDIHKTPAEKVPSVTMATASFPCNDLSLAGGRAGLKAGHSSSFWEFIRILKDMGERRPPVVLLENVPGFLTSNKGSDFHEALRSLNKLGYSVDAFILDAANFVPQSRQRLFATRDLEAARNRRW